MTIHFTAASALQLVVDSEKEDSTDTASRSDMELIQNYRRAVAPEESATWREIVFDSNDSLWLAYVYVAALTQEEIASAGPVWSQYKDAS